MFETSLYRVNSLFQHHQINDEIVQIERLSGTTAGFVLKLESKQDHTYILKYDNPNEIHLVEHLLNTYEDSIYIHR